MERYTRMRRQTWRDDLEEIADDELRLDTEADETPFGGSSPASLTHPKRKKRKGQERRSVATSRVPDDDTDVFPDDDEIDELRERKAREKRRAGISEPFKCRNCRAFIGEPPTGGRQRNHCPMCLHSLHVDDKTPGDRASECRSLMRPIGVFYRPNLEEMVVHECLGCGFMRYNRIAADDNVVLLGELPVVDPTTMSRGDDSSGT